MKKIINFSDVIISSADRNKTDSNILSDKVYRNIKKNALSFIQNSKVVKLLIQDHDITRDDIIVIQNATFHSIKYSFSLNLTPSFIKVDISKYVSSFLGYQNEIINVQFISYNEYLFGNIPVNPNNQMTHKVSIINQKYLVLYINNLVYYSEKVENVKIRFDEINIEDIFRCSLHKVSLTLDISDIKDQLSYVESLQIQSYSNFEHISANLKFSQINGSYTSEILDDKYLLLETNLLNVEEELSVKNANIEIIIQKKCGVNINEINAFYPLSLTTNKKGYHFVSSVDKDSVYFLIDSTPTHPLQFGENSLVVKKIESQIKGHESSNFYSINLFKTFYDVISLEVVHSVFPSFIKNVSDEQSNNVLEWTDKDNNSYQIKIESYFYQSLEGLMEEITHQINLVTLTNNVKFYSEFSLNSERTRFELFFYTKTILIQPFTLEGGSFGSIGKIVVYYPNHNLKEDNEIVIKNAMGFNGIPSTLINSSHNITIIDKNTFFFYLYRYDIDSKTLGVNNKGGNNVTILILKKVRLTRTNLSTMLCIENYSVFEYKKKNTKPVQLNPVSFNIFLDLNGVKNINIFSKNGLTNTLTKIYYDANNAGDKLVNSHTKNELLFNPPLSSLHELKLSIMDDNRHYVDFFNMDHEFILRIKYIDYLDT